MTTQTMVHIGNVVRNAVLFNPQQWRKGAIAMDELLRTVDELFALLHERKMKYVLVGGIALLQYVEGRNTEDIDFIFNITSLKKIPEITLTRQDVYFARGDFRGLQIDFLLTKNPLFAYVQKNHVAKQPFFEQTITTATVQGLLLLKLYALPSLYRQGDFARVGIYENDVATLMFYHTPNMSETLKELTPFVSTQDLAAIQEILRDLELRIARFQRKKDTGQG